MSNLQTTTFLEYDVELHEEAGLAYAGLNKNGSPTYIGTDKQWEAFNKLTRGE